MAATRAAQATSELLQDLSHGSGWFTSTKLDEAFKRGANPWGMLPTNASLLALLLNKTNEPALISWLERVGDLSASPWPQRHPNPMEVALDYSYHQDRRDLTICGLLQQGLDPAPFFVPGKRSFFKEMAQRYWRDALWPSALQAFANCDALADDVIPFADGDAPPLRVAVWRAETHLIDTYLGLCQDHGMDGSDWTEHRQIVPGILYYLMRRGAKAALEHGIPLDRRDGLGNTLLHMAFARDAKSQDASPRTRLTRSQMAALTHLLTGGFDALWEAPNSAGVTPRQLYANLGARNPASGEPTMEEVALESAVRRLEHATSLEALIPPAPAARAPRI